MARQRIAAAASTGTSTYCSRMEATRAEIQQVCDSLPSLQDRTVTTGIVSPEASRANTPPQLRRPRVGPRIRRAQGVPLRTL